MSETVAVPLTVRGTSEWTLRPAAVTVLLGPNGAGKTHWLEQLAGLRDPEGLQVFYGAEPLWRPRRRGAPRLNRRALLQYAYASQTPEEQLLARTAEEELLGALQPYRLAAERQDARIRAALAAVGWDDSWRDRQPFRMSGGEKRRLGLACLLATPANWLLLDEPTAGLDAAGQLLLAERLRERRDAGGGVLIVSHDSEWALQLADCVLLMSSAGELRECAVGDLLAEPRLWADAGLPLPAWLLAAGPLVRVAGLAPGRACDPAAAAAAWARLERERASAASEGPALRSAGFGAAAATLCRPHGAAAPAAPSVRTLGPGEQAAPDPRPLPAAAAARFSQASRPRGRDTSANPLASFDPKAMWLAYLLLSMAILTLRHWIGVGAAGLTVGAALALGRVSLRRWRGILLGFALFSLTVSAVAGLGWRGSFHSGAFWLSLHSMARTFLVMLLGLGLATSITTVRLKRSLEQLLSVRGTLSIPAQKITLTVSLLVRFIPVFLSEWERFDRLAVARGKATSRSFGPTLRRLKHTALPFMLSLLRIGEQIALALESRGVGRRKTPALIRSQRWRKRDTVLLAVALAVAGALWRCFG